MVECGMPISPWLRKALEDCMAIDNLSQRGLFAGSTATKEELVARVKANLRAPQT